MMKSWKNHLKFALALLPVTIPAVVVTILYMMDASDPALIQQMLEQVGSKWAIVALSSLQSITMVFAVSFFGHALADRCGLLKPLTFEKKPVLLALLFSAILAALLLTDTAWLAGRYPALHRSNAAGMTAPGIASAILYGGIVEELLMRLGVMTLFSWILWKVFARTAAQTPVWTLIAANIAAAALFAAGHLPATVSIFGSLTPLLVIRCFLLNGLGGLFFGRLYRKFGLHYAMLSHMGAHLLNKLFFLILF